MKTFPLAKAPLWVTATMCFMFGAILVFELVLLVIALLAGQWAKAIAVAVSMVIFAIAMQYALYVRSVHKRYIDRKLRNTQ